MPLPRSHLTLEVEEPLQDIPKDIRAQQRMLRGPLPEVPVQLSVHKEGRDGRLTHHEWLADGPADPRETWRAS